MPVHCTNCGEELLGAVNRCWRCGARFIAQSGSVGVPPVRQAPLDAVLVDSGADAEPPASAEPVGSAELPNAPSSSDTTPRSASAGQKTLTTVNGGAGDIEQRSAPAASSPQITGESDAGPAAYVETAVEVIPSQPSASDAIRRGSPFADGYRPATPARRATQAASTTTQLVARPAKYPQHAAAVGGAIAALVLGILSMISLLINAVGALITAVLGIPLGLWGLYSERRVVAILGLVLCCLAMATAGFFCVVMLFEWINGYDPFEGPPGFDEPFLEEDDVLGALRRSGPTGFLLQAL